MSVKFCKNCFTPNTRPRIVFNNHGICNACLNSKEKKKTNWKQREKEFYKIISNIKKDSKKNKRTYDCIVPWSGGKDSSSIALKLKYNFGLNPLLVTFSPLIINEIGAHNREELLKKGFDSIFFRPNQDIARILAKRFFIERGNPKVAWDAGINSVPVQAAIAYKVPYIFYAEHGESEYGGLVLSEKSKKLRDVKEVIEHQIGDYPDNWVSDNVTKADLSPYVYPDEKILKKNKILAYYFSYFFRWSMFDNYNYVKKILPNFKENSEGRTEGTFTNFDSLDDKIDDLYYYMQYIKFGFGRSTRDVSRFIQNRHLNKSEGLKFIKKYDGEYPQRNLQVVLDYLSLKQYDFDEIVDKHRNLEIWKPKGNNWELINKL
jgi:N-acetyl sugar amidotransferase